MAKKLIFSLFADDMTILAKDNLCTEAEAAAQWAVDLVAKWSAEWKLNLNASKSGCSDQHEHPQKWVFRLT